MTPLCDLEDHPLAVKIHTEQTIHTESNGLLVAVRKLIYSFRKPTIETLLYVVLITNLYIIRKI